MHNNSDFMHNRNLYNERCIVDNKKPRTKQVRLHVLDKNIETLLRDALTVHLRV